MFDKIKSVFSSKADLAPSSKLQTRRHKSARPSRLAGFSTNSPSKMEVNRMDLMGTVAHSRFLAENNDYYRSFLLMCRRHIIGKDGIKLNPVAKRGDKLDEKDNETQLKAWLDWGRKGNCTVCGRFSFVQIQQMLAMMVPRDGGVFIRHWEGKDFGPHGYQIQLLTVDRLAADYNQKLLNGYISGGVECNELDKIVAWHFYKSPPGSPYFNRGQRVRVPASDISYVSVFEDYSVHLNLPWGYTAAARLNGVGGFEEAALTAARAGASKMGFIVDKEKGEIAGPEQGDDEEFEMEEFEAGMIDYLPDGKDFVPFDPGYPDGESPLFMKLMLRGAAAGMGVSYNGLAGDLESTNFSSLHVGKDEERDEWRIVQSWFAESFNAIVHARWLPRSILHGQTQLPMTKLDKFMQVEWQPRGWSAVNPVQEANANITNIKALLDSPQRVLARKGLKLSDVIDEIAQAQQMADAKGLEFEHLLIPLEPEPKDKD